MINEETAKSAEVDDKEDAVLRVSSGFLQQGRWWTTKQLLPKAADKDHQLLIIGFSFLGQPRTGSCRNGFNSPTVVMSIICRHLSDFPWKISDAARFPSLACSCAELFFAQCDIHCN